MRHKDSWKYMYHWIWLKWISELFLLITWNYLSEWVFTKKKKKCKNKNQAEMKDSLFF